MFSKTDACGGLYIAPGSVISGFVFTNVDEGTKTFNVDILTENGPLISFTLSSCGCQANRLAYQM